MKCQVMLRQGGEIESLTDLPSACCDVVGGGKGILLDLVVVVDEAADKVDRVVSVFCRQRLRSATLAVDTSTLEVDPTLRIQLV